MKDLIARLHLVRLWLSISIAWLFGVCLVAWINAGLAWPPPLPDNQFNWIIAVAVLIGPPLLLLIVANIAIVMIREKE